MLSSDGSTWERGANEHPAGLATRARDDAAARRPDPGEVVTPIVVVAAVDQDRPELLDGVVVTPDENDARGPLEGLRAGLKALPLVEDLSAGAGRGGSSAFAQLRRTAVARRTEAGWTRLPNHCSERLVPGP
jgi:hypothetical protein